MNVTYFPGCTLRGKAKTLDACARASLKALGVDLREPDDWQCCGGVYSTARDEIASKLPSVRALIAARDRGEVLLTVCSACHNVIKQTNHAMKTDPDFAARVNNYLAQEDIAPYHGEVRPLHFLELLRDEIGFDTIKTKVVAPLSGDKLAAYYGCLLLRPSRVMRMDDPENPTIMEDFLRAIGAEPVIWPARNECCGGYISLEDRDAARKQSIGIAGSAASHGASGIVTACPLCRYNLINSGSDLPVLYFTELLAAALGVKEC